VVICRNVADISLPEFLEHKLFEMKRSDLLFSVGLSHSLTTGDLPSVSISEEDAALQLQNIKVTRKRDNVEVKWSVDSQPYPGYYIVEKFDNEKQQWRCIEEIFSERLHDAELCFLDKMPQNDTDSYIVWFTYNR
jgi:hypothetical protein